MILCGSAHSGKSSTALLMIDILTQIQLSTSGQQQKRLSTSHPRSNDTVCIRPFTVTLWTVLRP
jgi:hypothetical protein